MYSLFAYVATGYVTLSLALSALSASVDSYAHSQKLGEEQVCVATSYKFPAQERPAFVAACAAKAGSAIDEKFVRLHELIDTLTIL